MKDFKLRLIINLILVIFVFIILGFRVIYVQVVKHKDLKAKFDKQFVRYDEVEAPRGNIFDRNGEVLAMSIPVESYFCIPQSIKNPEKTIYFLKDVFSSEENYLKEKIYKKKTFFWLKRKLPIEDSLKLKEKKFPKGIGVLKESKRFYPNLNLASHLLGFISIDNHGLSGVEYSMDNYLKGNKIKKMRGRDAIGRRISFEYDFFIGNDSSSDVYLTIDKFIQYIADKSADKLFKKSQALSVSIIVQDVKSFEILALVNKPDFDPNNISKYEKGMFKNIAISNVYEPGSTLKPVVVGVALQNDVIKTDEMIFCENGKYKVYKHIIKDHEPKGWLSLEDVIAYSSNIGMSKIGEKLSDKHLYVGLMFFGFKNYSGVDLSGESKGILDHPSRWSGLTKQEVSFGQGIGVNSMQLINAYSCIANGGELLEPQIVKSIKKKKSNKFINTRKRTVRKVLDKDICDFLINSMKKVVNYGTAVAAKSDVYKIAGKTGTAQKINPETGRYYLHKYISSFIGFFPADDPKISILVTVDEPKGLYWGGYLCGPTFKSMAEEIGRYLKIPRDEMGEII